VPRNAAMMEPALDPATTRGRRPAWNRPLITPMWYRLRAGRVEEQATKCEGVVVVEGGV
jgi:hypothetical protein